MTTTHSIPVRLIAVLSAAAAVGLAAPAVAAEPAAEAIAPAAATEAADTGTDTVPGAAAKQPARKKQPNGGALWNPMERERQPPRKPVPDRSRDDERWGQRTLFGGAGDIEHGGFGGPTIKGTELLGSTSILVGGRGAWQANHGVFIGGGGIGMATEHRAPAAIQVAGQPTRNLQIGYGGLWLGYTILSDTVVHPVVSVLVGAGGAVYEGRDAATGTLDEVETDVFFVTEPEVAMEINVLPFMRLAVGLGYRIARSVQMTGLDQDDLSKLVVTTDIRFGRF